MTPAELRAAVISHRQGHTTATELQEAVTTFVGNGKEAAARQAVATRTLRALNNGNNIKLRAYLRATTIATTEATTEAIPLTAVKGIGTKTADLLTSIGYASAQELAHADVLDLADLLTSAGSKLEASTLIHAAIEAIGAESFTNIHI